MIARKLSQRQDLRFRIIGTYLLSTMALPSNFRTYEPLNLVLGLGFQVSFLLPTANYTASPTDRFEKILRVLKVQRFNAFPLVQHCPFTAWHAPFGAPHHLSPKRGNRGASPFSSSVSSPPFGGDAVGRGGTASGSSSMLDIRLRFGFPNPQSLATNFLGYWTQATSY